MDAERALLRATALEVVVAEDTSPNIADVLSKASEAQSGDSTGLIDIKRRELVFVDERVRVLVVVSVPPCDEHVLKSCLARGSMQIEAWAQDVATSNGSTADPSKDMIASATVDLTEEPVVVAQESETGQGTSLILVWSAQIPLTRPRVRMLDPAVSFYSVLSVTSPNQTNEQEQLLIPFESIERNVFETLRLPPGQGPPPYLPASALSKIVPLQKSLPHQHRIEHMSTRIRLVPVVVTRMTYHRTESHAKANPCIVGALNVEVIPFVELQAEILTLQVSMAHGIVEDLTKGLLPLKCRSRDLMTFLYRLTQAKAAVGTGVTTASQLPNFDVLSIRLELAVVLSEACRPKVVMDFTTNIDFFQALNPSYGGPGQPMQRSHRPASLPLNNQGNQSQTSLDTTLQPVLNLASFNGVSVSFTAPSGPVKVGKPFTWGILVNNRSARAAKLAVYPLPRISRAQSQGAASSKRHVSRVSMASLRSRDQQRALDNDTESTTAQAVVDENVIYALQHSNGPQNQGDVVALTAELRIGGLGPGQCHEGEIEFLPLKAGTFQIDTIRVVDVNREAEEGIGSLGVMLDLYDLPDIIVEE